MMRDIIVKSALAFVAFLTFSLLSPKWVFPACAWIAPAALLLFIDFYKSVRGLWFGFLVLLAAGLVANFRVMPFPAVLMVIVTIQTTLFAFVPYVIRRLTANVGSAFPTTLIFPASAVTVEYLSSFFGGGTWGSIAYTQIDNASITQLASVTGLWGISFLIYWFNAVVVWIWNHRLEWKTIRFGVSVFAGILVAVYTFGIVRLNPLSGSSSGKIRVAGITDFNFKALSQMYEDAFGKRVEIDPLELTQTSPELQELNRGLAEFIADPFNLKFLRSRQVLYDFEDAMFARAKKEADAGAKLIAFSEALFFTLKPTEEKLLEKASTFAKDNNVRVILAVASFFPGKIEIGAKYLENKAITIAPNGSIENIFFKNKPVPIVEGSIPGDGKIPAMKTSFGNLATSICYDADFPTMMRQAGEQKTDLLVLPSGDWKEVSPYHANMARMRAIENGFSMLRPVSNATSIACDYKGRVISAREFFDAAERTVIAYVPTKGISTIYAAVGDVLPWCCIVVVMASACYALYIRQQNTNRS